MRVATEVPLETMRACAKRSGSARRRRPRQPVGASDVGVGVQLALSRLQGARLQRRDQHRARLTDVARLRRR